MTGVVAVISRETTVGSDEKSPKHLVVILTVGRNPQRKDHIFRGYLSRASFDMTGVVVVISRETTVGRDEKSPKERPNAQGISQSFLLRYDRVLFLVFVVFY
jgi:hypothetical protein